jgi:probable rRNA maturation factor
LSKNCRWIIDVADEQSVLKADRHRIRLAVERVLEQAAVRRAEISVAVVEDSTIRELNHRYLDHDCATDVLSFVLAHCEERLDGQIVVSAEMARSQAARYGWSPADELLLYIVHGALHLVGYDDATPADRAEMRRQERTVLARFDLAPRWTPSPARRHRKQEGRIS